MIKPGFLTGLGASLTDGYTSGGTTGTSSDVIDKFAFGTPANATDFGDLTVARYATAGQNSSSDGYASGGYTGTGSNVIDKFQFGTSANATDFGDLTVARQAAAGQSSSSD